MSRIHKVPFIKPGSTVYLSMVLWTILNVAASDATSIGIVPTSTVVNPGHTFAVDVSVSDVADLFAFTFDVQYEHTVIQALGVTEGGFLRQGRLNTTGTDFGLPFVLDADLTDGFITGIANSVIMSTGVHGSGLLASIIFQPLT